MVGADFGLRYLKKRRLKPAATMIIATKIIMPI